MQTYTSFFIIFIASIIDIELSQNSVLDSIIRIIQDCFHNKKLGWSLQKRDPKKQILSFGIGSVYIRING